MIKYSRLTKEQFEELHKEFIHFLAAQTITSDEWEQLKKDRPEAAEQELDVFSDLIWEGVLNKTEYLDKIDPQHLSLFKMGTSEMKLLVVKILDHSIDLTTSSGFDWLKKNLTSDDVELLTAAKNYSEDKNLDKFKLIEQGAIISKGEWYQTLDQLIRD